MPINKKKVIEDKQIYVIKMNGERELFNPQKLHNSLYRAGAKQLVIEEVLKKIGKEVKPEMTTSEIYRLAFSMLHVEQKKTAFRYSLRRAVNELGPTGFGFEKFVAEIFKARGYETKTDQIVNGYCISHEVDVVAWDKDNLLMCEAKFHNDMDLKSDVKIALYVQARMEDLAKVNHSGFGTPDRKMTEGWLITNTKFSSAAIQYGMCRNLKMVGWNFPQITNLHSMIEVTRTVPITALQSLTQEEKQRLIGQGLVLCLQINSEVVLAKNGIPKTKIKKVLDEITEATNILGNPQNVDF
ncbi:MAG: ATP cone domain-containing protein [Minisyncoccia bacterium]